MTSETNRRKQKLTVKDLITVGRRGTSCRTGISFTGRKSAKTGTDFYCGADDGNLLLCDRHAYRHEHRLSGRKRIGRSGGEDRTLSKYKNQYSLLHCFLPRRNRVLSCIFHQSASLGKQDVGKGHTAGIPGYNGGNRQPADFDNHVGRHCFSRPFQRFYRQSTVKEAI